LQVAENVAKEKARNRTIASNLAAPRSKDADAVYIDFDLEDEEDTAEELTEEQLRSLRANEILHNVWVEYSARMYSRTTSKDEFYEDNMQMALSLADKELQAQKDARKRAEVRKFQTPVLSIYNIHLTLLSSFLSK